MASGWRFIFNLNLSGILSTGSLLSSISFVIPPIRVATMEDWDPITNIYILPSMAPASPLPRPRVGSQPLPPAQQAPSLIHSLHFLYWLRDAWECWSKWGISHFNLRLLCHCLICNSFLHCCSYSCKVIISLALLLLVTGTYLELNNNNIIKYANSSASANRVQGFRTQEI